VSKPVLGIAENLKVVACDDSEHWHLIADIETDSPEAFCQFAGISISFTSPIFETEGALLSIGLPYPIYNDDAFSLELHRSTGIDVVKWRKKSFTPDQTAIILSLVLFALGPAWQELYAKVIAPEIANFAIKGLTLLKEKELTLEFHQRIEFEGQIVELRFFADRESQPKLLSNPHLIEAIQMAEVILRTHEIQSNSVGQIIFTFDRIGRRFSADRLEFVDGSSMDLDED
jgi:hypothetical protein